MDPSFLLLHLLSTSEEPAWETMSPDYNVNSASVNNAVAGMTTHRGSICFTGERVDDAGGNEAG